MPCLLVCMVLLALCQSIESSSASVSDTPYQTTTKLEACAYLLGCTVCTRLLVENICITSDGCGFIVQRSLRCSSLPSMFKVYGLNVQIKKIKSPVFSITKYSTDMAITVTKTEEWKINIWFSLINLSVDLIGHYFVSTFFTKLPILILALHRPLERTILWQTFWIK